MNEQAIIDKMATIAKDTIGKLSVQEIASQTAYDAIAKAIHDEVVKPLAEGLDYYKSPQRIEESVDVFSVLVHHVSPDDGYVAKVALATLEKGNV